MLSHLPEVLLDQSSYLCGLVAGDFADCPAIPIRLRARRKRRVLSRMSTSAINPCLKALVVRTRAMLLPPQILISLLPSAATHLGHLRRGHLVLRHAGRRFQLYAIDLPQARWKRLSR